MPKERLDQLVVQRELAESREKAQRLIRSGVVRVNGAVASKPGHTFPADATIDVTAGMPFVSRGGEKLEAAFQHFQLDVDGAVCLDVGASTGGFTDCLLQHGASTVYAVDVGKGQLHWNLRNDPRVVVMENFNARNLRRQDLAEAPTFGVVDVSFISLEKILPPVRNVLSGGACIVTLIKPQFEAGRENVRKGGVVTDPRIHEQVVSGLREFGTAELKLHWRGVCPSPLKGPAGNVEFLACWST